MAKKKGSSDKKGKKPHKNKPTSKKYALFADGKKPRHCPRCGPGVFLGGGLNRIHCGKCHYTEFKTE